MSKPQSFIKTRKHCLQKKAKSVLCLRFVTFKCIFSAFPGPTIVQFNVWTLCEVKKKRTKTLKAPLASLYQQSVTFFPLQRNIDELLERNSSIFSFCLYQSVKEYLWDWGFAYPYPLNNFVPERKGFFFNLQAIP